ncbi:unnamed protein product [marine sediment metagenome]|uniref:Uncharacterized protein n=1 Tax=marine sediment metagenome TaxID=412755 RepID=X1BCG7_9ZZZZ
MAGNKLGYDVSRIEMAMRRMSALGGKADILDTRLAEPQDEKGAPLLFRR